jgi:hypothetical protein
MSAYFSVERALLSDIFLSSVLSWLYLGPNGPKNCADRRIQGYTLSCDYVVPNIVGVPDITCKLHVHIGEPETQAANCFAAMVCAYTNPKRNNRVP